MFDLLLRGFAPRFVQRLFKKRLERYELRDYIDPASDKPVLGVPVMSGCCMLVKRKAIDTTGGFDPRYFLYFEDIDWCLRLRRVGKRTVYFPGVTVRHIGGASTGDMAARKELIYRTSQRTMFGTYCGAASMQGLLWYQRLKGLISFT